MPDDNFNRYCEELLARYTRRNQQAVTRHLESLSNMIRDQGHVVQTMYGGDTATQLPSYCIDGTIGFETFKVDLANV